MIHHQSYYSSFSRKINKIVFYDYNYRRLSFLMTGYFVIFARFIIRNDNYSSSIILRGGIKTRPENMNSNKCVPYIIVHRFQHDTILGNSKMNIYWLFCFEFSPCFFSKNILKSSSVTSDTILTELLADPTGFSRIIKLIFVLGNEDFKHYWNQIKNKYNVMVALLSEYQYQCQAVN